MRNPAKGCGARGKSNGASLAGDSRTLAPTPLLIQEQPAVDLDALHDLANAIEQRFDRVEFLAPSDLDDEKLTLTVSEVSNLGFALDDLGGAVVRLVVALRETIIADDLRKLRGQP